MNVKKVVKELQEKYPGKKIIKNNEKNPTEILCEIDPATKHPHYSLAVAVINKSRPHLHQKSKETYQVIKGILDLFVDGKKYKLSEGEKFIINPGQIHWANGNETWIECYSKPGWIIKDHIFKEYQKITNF
ncbi:hypothetical protein A3J78_01010 [Candidatus Beckwithbacteria bacterium RBG_13_35_6]|uniref:Cupin type-2 domain-containing protein n=1 Tax=Candidatus Beckwithbacteria bacterium RBG_13_35_6 TaxID=1797456 RepID=A0A1F5DDX9_9BACT|nr:MAG: hypothetical protein A3J78_01010 [Candidatus Beckwithbacteria bacterium RBG_13_35_6]